MMKLLIAAVMLALAGCGDSDKPPYNPTPDAKVEQPQPAKANWQIGPWIGIENYSKRCPLHPTSNSDGSFWFDIKPCEPHYVTGPAVASLTHAKQIRARFRIEGPADAIIHGAGCPVTSQSRLSLYFEEKSVHRDNAFFRNGGRWWTKVRHPLVVNTEFEMIAPLDDMAKWGTALGTDDPSNLPTWFDKAKANTARVGFTFGNCTGAGHGATATRPVRFTVLEFAVE